MTRRLLALNGLAIIFAVIHHVLIWDLTAMFWWTDRYLSVTVPNFDAIGSWRYTTLHLLDQAAIAAVFAFILVSGYFASVSIGHAPQNMRWRLVFQHIRAFLIPYLAWSSITLVYNLLNGRS